MKTIMVDLEGTMSDHTDRLRVLEATTAADPKNREAWKTYYKGLPDDEPRMDVIRAVREWIKREHFVMVYSTRFANKYRHEEEWLKGHELWEHIELLQRESTETQIKGPNLVAIWAGSIKPDILVDDREDVRALVREHSPDTTVLGPEDFHGREVH
jgi:hypothetical protein